MLGFPEPTYSLYPVLSQIEGAKALGVAWDKDWTLPVEALAECGADAIYIANPNAPSGTFVPPSQIGKLAGPV